MCSQAIRRERIQQSRTRRDGEVIDDRLQPPIGTKIVDLTIPKLAEKPDMPDQAVAYFRKNARVIAPRSAPEIYSAHRGSDIGGNLRGVGSQCNGTRIGF